MMLQDISGLFVAVTSPSLPIIVKEDVGQLSENKIRLAKEQTKIEIFEVGTGNLALSLDMRMPIK
jgi:hypothetical protein